MPDPMDVHALAIAARAPEVKPPKPLSVTQAGKTLSGKELAAWKSATPEERQRATDLLNRQRMLQHQSEAFDRFQAKMLGKKPPKKR